MKVTRVIDSTLYPRKAIADARQAFREYCSVQQKPLDGNAVEVSVTVDARHAADWQRVVLEFFNYALDRSAQLHFQTEG